jgi:hypothetical protein
VPNEEGNTPYFQQVPRTGSFEVSYKGMLIFSKLKGGYWPNCELVADKCMMVVQDEMEGKDCAQYLAGSTPLKGNEGAFAPSAKKTRSSFKDSSPGIKSDMTKNNSNNQAAFEVDEAPLRDQVQVQSKKYAGADVKVGSHL